MRAQLCEALVRRAENPDMVFLTGDLGFMALEPLREKLGPRFINAGVAEQNMISVAAALAREGLQAWTYTIAPFCYARGFEQIRNDVCFHELPVKLLGNGGGYGYGVMGATHHALEDYGVLLTLPQMRVFVPAFDEDVEEVVGRAAGLDGPCYVRLGRGELPRGFAAPAYAPWRKLLDGTSAVMVAVGPLAGVALEALKDVSPTDRPELWSVVELPLEASPPPPEFLRALRDGRSLCVFEEHVAHGGCGHSLLAHAIEAGAPVSSFRHLAARDAVASTYGSQAFMRRQSGLDAQTIRQLWSKAAAE
jgi:transketolase